MPWKHYNPNIDHFQMLKLNKIKASWLNKGLIPAYNYDFDDLNKDLQNLNDNLYQTVINGDKVNPSLSNIWSWTYFINWDEVKVVIVGNQPTNQVECSGRAFHPLDENKVSTTSRAIFDQVAETFNLPEPDEDGDFNLNGWIRQGVVLVNAMTTKGMNGDEHSAWIPIMDRLLTHLYNTKPEVEFILVGSRPRQEFLYEEHYNDTSYNPRIQLAHHPCYNNQHQDTRFFTFGQALLNCKANIDWTDLDMFNNYY